MSTSKDKLVKVFWRDISSISCDDEEAAWISKETLLRNAKKAYKKEYITVGYLVESNKKYIVIAATKDDEAFADASMIMKSVIIRIEKL